MSREYSGTEIASRSAIRLKAGSALVRRLARADDDPGKQRVREWLLAIDDERLISFGLSPDDIAILRGIQR